MTEQRNFRRNYYTSDDSGKIYIASLLAPFLVLFLWMMLSNSIVSTIGEKLDGQLWYLIISSILGQLAFLATFLIYNKMAKVAFSATNVKFKLGWRNILICLVVAVVALFGIQYFISCVDHVLSLIGYSLKNDPILPLDNFGWFILNVFVLAFLPAVCEELIFRGVILSGLRKNMSDMSAIALSAFMFALMHGSLQQLVYPFLLGLIFGLIVVRTGSTFASMLIHFTNNFLVILFTYMQNVVGFEMLGFTNSWWFYLLSIGLLILSGVIIYLIDKFHFKHKNQTETEKLGTRPSLFVWIGLAVAGVMLLFSIISNFISGS